MHVMLTRPRPDSERLAALLRAGGDDVHVEPMLEIVGTGAVPSLESIQAVLATSANGMRHLAALTDNRQVAVFAVGDSTAQCAMDAGFASVESAQGDSGTLAALVTYRLNPAAGALLHARGAVSTGDLAERLEGEGFTVNSVVLYRADPATRLSPEGRACIMAEKCDAILFFSPRTARTFVSLIKDAGLQDHCARLIAFCLSRAVAEEAAALPWRDLQVAATPDQDAMIGAFEAMKQTRETGDTN